MPWLNSAIEYVTSLHFIVNRVLISVVIFVIGLIVGRLAGNFVRKLLGELEVNRVVKRATSTSPNVEDRAGTIVSYLIYAFAGILALDQLGVATPLLIGFGGFILLIVALAFILGVKDYIPNFIAGILIYKKELFLKGDVISIDDLTGKVTKIGLVETELRSGGDRIFIPNSTIIKKEVRVKPSEPLK